MKFLGIAGMIVFLALQITGYDAYKVAKVTTHSNNSDHSDD